MERHGGMEATGCDYRNTSMVERTSIIEAMQSTSTTHTGVPCRRMQFDRGRNRRV